MTVCRHGRRDDDQKGSWRVGRRRQRVPPSRAGFADELRELAAVAAAQVQNRAAGDITENVSLGRPLDQPIQ